MASNRRDLGRTNRTLIYLTGLLTWADRNRLAELSAEMDKFDVDRDRVRRERDKTIKRAPQGRDDSREIARISGVSHQRVHQIVTDSR